jgi:hypothetical protein
VLFERELALEGVEDRLDPLAHPQELSLGGGGLPVAGGAAGRSDQVHPELVAQGLELGSGEALVGQDDLPGGDQVVVDLQVVSAVRTARPVAR